MQILNLSVNINNTCALKLRIVLFNVRIVIVNTRYGVLHCPWKNSMQKKIFCLKASFTWNILLKHGSFHKDQFTGIILHGSFELSMEKVAF